MAFTREQLIEDAIALVSEGVDILDAELAKNRGQAQENTVAKKRSRSASPAVSQAKPLPFVVAYQSWYTKALPLVRLVLPDRYVEFVEQYRIDKRKEITYLNYTVSDYLIGLRITRGGTDIIDPQRVVATKAQHQLAILRSCVDRLGSRLSDIQSTVRAELFDSELAAAEDLRSKGHLRAAGALAGVTLERHLGAVAASHNIKLAKKDPTIADLNEALKREEIIDVPLWRSIQRLADIRNLAVHNKSRDPQDEEISELIRGVEKTVKSLF